KSGVKPPNLSRLLKKDANPTLESISLLAAALDMDVDSLLRPSKAPLNRPNPWFDRDHLENDIKELVSKETKLSLQLVNEIDSDVIRELLGARRVIQDEIDNIQGRLEQMDLQENRMSIKQKLISKITS